MYSTHQGCQFCWHTYMHAHQWDKVDRSKFVSALTNSYFVVLVGQSEDYA